MLMDFIMMRSRIWDRRHGYVRRTPLQDKLEVARQNKLAEGPRPSRELHKMQGEIVDWQKPAAADPVQPGYFARQKALPPIDYAALIARCQLIPGKNARFHTAYALAQHLVQLDGEFRPANFVEWCMEEPEDPLQKMARERTA